MFKVAGSGLGILHQWHSRKLAWKPNKQPHKDCWPLSSTLYLGRGKEQCNAESEGLF